MENDDSKDRCTLAILAILAVLAINVVLVAVAILVVATTLSKMKMMPATSKVSNTSNFAIQVLIATVHRMVFAVLVLSSEYGDFLFLPGVRE